MPVFLLSEDSYIFPNPVDADPSGLIAIGGDLTPRRLFEAYSRGFFPWFNPGDEIMWWHPLERFVLFPGDLKVSKSMRPYFNQNKFRVSYNQSFKRVIEACARVSRRGQDGTWITEEMMEAYTHLHDLGFAHSVEVWDGEELVGGLYGIAIGKIFFGESMFSNRSNASKFGFISLVEILKKEGFLLIDCQQETRHLASMGAKSIAQKTFITYLNRNIEMINSGTRIKWKN